VIVHDRVGVIVLIVVAAGALLALLSMWRPQLLPAVRVYLRLSVAAVALQVFIGLLLVATGQRPPLLHWIYGAATLAALPLALAIGSRMGDREEHLWVVGGAVAAVLLAFRAVATG
jgi:heme A synthase